MRCAQLSHKVFPRQRDLVLKRKVCEYHPRVYGKEDHMATITSVELRIRTADTTDAGTDGDVFLGFGGREFFVDSGGDDFARGADRVYIFGENANVLRPDENDPRSPLPIDSNELSRFPIYLRLAAGAGMDWHIGLVHLVARFPNSSVTLSRLEGNANIWLGWKRGLYLYL